jgi:hypothetical protein
MLIGGDIVLFDMFNPSPSRVRIPDSSDEEEVRCVSLTGSDSIVQL